MAKPCSAIRSTDASKAYSSPTTRISNDIPLANAKETIGYFQRLRFSDDPVVDDFSSADSYSDIVGGHLKTDSIQRGRIRCLLTVKPPIANHYGGLHGGAVAAVAERLSIACARTVVSEDKELFLGELSISYLSGAPKNAELTVDGSVVRSGRNLTVVEMEFKTKGSGKLLYTAKATLYNSAISKL